MKLQVTRMPAMSVMAERMESKSASMPFRRTLSTRLSAT